MRDIFNSKKVAELTHENKLLEARIADLIEKLFLKDQALQGIGTIGTAMDDFVSASNIWPTISREHDIAVYIKDYYGGKVVEQESHPVTVLDVDGKATYHRTAKSPDKGYTYILERKQV